MSSKGVMSNCRSNICEIWAWGAWRVFFFFFLEHSQPVRAPGLCCAMLKYFLCFYMLSLDSEWSLITAPLLDKPQWNTGRDLMVYSKENSTCTLQKRQADTQMHANTLNTHRHGSLYAYFCTCCTAQSNQWWNEKMYIRWQISLSVIDI